MKKKYPTTRGITAALCILALSPALLFASNKAKVGEERGLIKAVDMNTHKLIVTEHRNKAEKTFSWDDRTKFTKRDQGVSAQALKAGEHVRLTYAAGKTPPVLQTVRILPPKTGNPTASNHSTARSTSANS